MLTAIGATDFGDPEGDDWRLLAALWARGWVTLSQLAAAWRTAVGDRITIPAVLLHERQVTAEQVAEAEQSGVTVDPQLLRQAVLLQLLRQRDDSGHLDVTTSLLREGLTAEWAALAAKAMLHSIHSVDLTEVEPDAAALQHVPGSVAREHQVLPIRIRWNERNPVLIVAVGDPDCIDAVDAVRDAARIKVQPVLADAGTLAAAIERHYPEA